MQLFILIFLFIGLNIFLFNNIFKISKIINIVDYPDEFRKKHTRPTPLLGGTFLLINIIFIILLDYYLKFIENIFNENVYFIFFSFVIYFIGIYDDKNDIKAKNKFFILLIIITSLLTLDNSLIVDVIYFETLKINFELNNFSFFFTILCLLLFLNACNMFDGINLQLAVYSLQIFIYFIFKEIYPIFSLFIIIFLIFFILFNKDEKIFFGDSGSFLLGFLISYMVLSFNSENNQQYMSAEEIFLIMALPGIDMFRLFLIRILNKKNPFSPDGNHIHHLLVKKYGFVKATILIQLIISLCLILGTFFNYITIISLLTVFYIFLIYKFRKLFIQ